MAFLPYTCSPLAVLLKTAPPGLGLLKVAVTPPSVTLKLVGKVLASVKSKVAASAGAMLAKVNRDNATPPRFLRKFGRF